MDEKKLSLSMIEPVFAAIRPMYHSALYKRPKGHVIAPGAAKVVETSIRFVLPELLVTKAEAAGRNAAIREQSQSGRMPPHEDIVISILDVGTFSMTDIDTMKEWHSLQKKISRARALTKWIDGRQDTEERRTILCKIPKMNMYSAFKSSLGETIVQFDDLTRFAGENWLSDGCVFVGALQLAVRMTANTHQCRGRIREIHAVDPVFLAFEDPEDRRRMVDTQRCIFSKGYESRVILSPVYINVDVPHWCGAIIDFGSKTIWIYDPKDRADYFAQVKNVVRTAILPLIDSSWKPTIRRSSAWLQLDGHNCGVLVVKWFETYLSVAMNTSAEEDLQILTPQLISEADLNDCRYKLFASVFLDVCNN